MSAFHNSLSGEQLALRWHQFGRHIAKLATIASLLYVAWCLFFAIVLILIVAFVSLPPTINLVLYLGAALAVMAAGCHGLCAINAFGGIHWHKEAEGDHKEEIARKLSSAQPSC